MLYVIRYKKHKLAFALVFINLAFCLESFSQDNSPISHHYACTLEDSTYGSEWINLFTKTQGTGSSGICFSKTDKTNPYGLGLQIPLPANLQHRNFKISVRGMFRITDALSNNSLVVSLSRGDSIVFWQGKNVVEKFGQLNAWNSFYDSVLIPRNITGDSKLKIFMWNQDGKSETWVDDLEIYLTTVELPSFLPK
jgi:hypothetical protein